PARRYRRLRPDANRSHAPGVGLDGTQARGRSTLEAGADGGYGQEAGAGPAPAPRSSAEDPMPSIRFRAPLLALSNLVTLAVLTLQERRTGQGSCQDGET